MTGTRACRGAAGEPSALPLPARVALLAQTARVLHANGQRTEVTDRWVRRLGAHLGLAVCPVFGWRQIALRVVGASAPVPPVAATPNGVNMARVDAAMAAVSDVVNGRTSLFRLRESLSRAEHLAATATPLFALAAISGALALAVIFGAHRWPALGLIALGAALGALARRWLGVWGVGAAGQAFAAALIAGVLGALAVRWQWSGAARLVAVCPCMILVPGPHILNGALDLLARRWRLGLARLGFAALTLAAISAGVLLGLALGGTDLPALPPGQPVAWWLDMLAAGVAAASYSVYFSAPRRMIGWAVLIGALAHGARWLAMAAGAGVVMGSLVAALLAGTLVMALTAHRLPCTAVGFAAVVAMVPGVYVFRAMGAGLRWTDAGAAHAERLQSAALLDLRTALLMTAALVAGLALPVWVREVLLKRPGA